MRYHPDDPRAKLRQHNNSHTHQGDATTAPSGDEAGALQGSAPTPEGPKMIPRRESRLNRWGGELEDVTVTQHAVRITPALRAPIPPHLRGKLIGGTTCQVVVFKDFRP